MAPEGDRPLILQKAGGLEGIFSYALRALAEHRRPTAINAFDAAAAAMTKTAKDLIAELAPR